MVDQDEHTDVPKLHEEDQVPAFEWPDAPMEEGRPAGRRRRAEEGAGAAEAPGRTTSDTVTEAQLVRAFYWLYRAWCRVLGAECDAKQADFQDLGKAWLELARKVPGIRWVIAAAGPVFTFTDLWDKLARAWEKRTRFTQPIRIPSWRQRSQSGAEGPDVHVVDNTDGPTGAA